MIKRIHVNQHHVKANAKDGGSRPVFTVKSYNSNRKGNRVTIDGPSRLVYQPDKPLGCGARAWVETEAEVELCVLCEFCGYEFAEKLGRYGCPNCLAEGG